MERWLITILANAKKMASPAILENIRESVQQMVNHAKTTENPWDDIFAWIMQMIVGKHGESTDKDE
ncbi:hypothetical protein LCGC14_0951610 [marine sediment metagenome]|uniref:Uncharacterized protein n=1 Tax=marine sediment metagenome TaxID=412755 RepID=A0A0F9P386_9ZZZZ